MSNYLSTNPTPLRLHLSFHNTYHDRWLCPRRLKGRRFVIVVMLQHKK